MAVVVMGYFGLVEIVLAFVCFLYLWALRKGNGLPRNWPVIGMIPGLIKNASEIHQSCTRIVNLAGGTFVFKGPWFLNMDMMVTVDPSNVHHIMSGNFPNYPKGPDFKKMFDVLGDGIFNSDMEMWKQQRKTTRFLINQHKFYRFLIQTSRNKVEQGLIPVLEKFSSSGKTVDLQDVFQRFTFDSTCTLVTGYDPGCLAVDLPDVPFSKAMDDAEEIIVKRHMLPEFVWKTMRFFNIGDEKRYKEAWKTLDEVIAKYISMKRQELTAAGEKDHHHHHHECTTDLLTSYIQENMSDAYLRDTILNLMIAGRDTTSSALTWFFYLLSQNPDVETKIRQELKTIQQVSDTDTIHVKPYTFNNIQEKLNGLVYLHGALCETLRLYPPVPFQHKEPMSPDTLPSGHIVHPKMKVMFSLYAMGRMESIWGKDCMEMKPERWISERGTVKHEPSYKFLAFNAGPRTCLGKDVAFTQLKAVASAIIHNYQIQVVEGERVIPNVSVILYSQNGLKVKVSKRWP